MGLFIKKLNRRWSLYIVKENQSAYAMHANCVMQIVGYVMRSFANGCEPVHPWDLYLCSNRQQIKLGSEHFTLDGDYPTPVLIQQIEAIDPRWNSFKAGEIWCEDISAKKDIKISEYAPGKIDVQALFDNIDNPQEVTFLSVIDEVFGKR